MPVPAPLPRPILGALAALLASILLAALPINAQEGIGERRPIAGETRAILSRTLPIIGIPRQISGALEELDAAVTETEIRIALPGDILFAFDSDALAAEALPTLAKVAEVLADFPGAPVLIEGHTDSKGSDSYNQALSERRAASVMRWLAEEGGAEPGRLTTQGFGESRPAAPNERPDGSDDPEGRQLNRRVEIVIDTTG